MREGKFTAIIAVREGSKRVQRKNIKKFADSSLLQIKIEHALKAKGIDEIVVSSDSDEMISLANEMKVKTIKRPSKFCSDSIQMKNVYKHLAESVQCDHVVYLHVTSPLLEISTLNSCISKYKELDNSYSSLATVEHLMKYIWFKNKAINYDPKNHIGEPVCGAGRHTMNITSEGNISPCNSLPLTYGNIKNDNIDEIWKNSSVGKKEKAQYNKEKSLSGSGSEKLSSWQGVARGDYDVCGDFKRCGWCQKCPGLAYLETGSELKPSTTNCRNSAARMIAYDLLKDHKTLAEILNKYDETLLEKKYNLETALWNPLSNIEKQKDPKLRSIIRERTKPTALEKLLKAEGLNQ